MQKKLKQQRWNVTTHLVWLKFVIKDNGQLSFGLIEWVKIVTKV